MSDDDDTPKGTGDFSINDLRWATDGANLNETTGDANKSREKLQGLLIGNHGSYEGKPGTSNGPIGPNNFDMNRLFNGLYPGLSGDYKVKDGELNEAFIEKIPPPDDSLDNIDIQKLFEAFAGVDLPSTEMIANWKTVGTHLATAGDTLQAWLARAKRLAESDNSEGWAGSTGDAVRGYLGQFEGLTKDLAACAKNMHYAYQAYYDALNLKGPIKRFHDVYIQILERWKAALYQDHKDVYDNWKKDLDNQYRDIVKTLTAAYHQRIAEASKHPAFNKVTLPEAPANVGGPPGSGSPGSGSPGTGPGGPGSGVPKTPTTPDLSKLLNNKTTPDPSKTTNPANSIQPLTDAAQSGLQGLGDAASQAANAGQEALQSGLDGAKQLADSLMNGNPAGLNEGALNLGPGALGKLGGAAAGAGKTGGGGGAGMRAPAMPKTTGVQMAEASKAATGTPAASRAGLASGAAGSPGAGAPAAGRGAGADGGKEHKASKALRTKANGEVVAGVAETNAVLPVVGGEPEPTPPPVQPAKR